MSRTAALLLGPEAILAALTGAVFVVCARHNSYADADVRLLEKLLLVLPLVVVPLAYAPLLDPAARSWLTLARVNLATILCLAICGYRIVSGFGAPGSGPKGQDAGLILVLSFGVALSAIANSIFGAMVLRQQKPAVAEWFAAHPVAGHLLTAAATLPMLVVQTVVTVAIVALVAAVASSLQR